MLAPPDEPKDETNLEGLYGVDYSKRVFDLFVSRKQAEAFASEVGGQVYRLVKEENK